MSSRWYPIYKKGNPQRRIFLPNFWMKLVRPLYKQPENIVQFITPTEMTDYDIKNYLEKIYKVPVAEIRSEIVEGDLKRQRTKGYVIKGDDYRRAFVTLHQITKYIEEEAFRELGTKWKLNATKLDAFIAVLFARGAYEAKNLDVILDKCKSTPSLRRKQLLINSNMEGEKFEFPDICKPKVEKDDEEFKKMKEQAEATFKEFSKRNVNRPGVPGWFGI